MIHRRRQPEPISLGPWNLGRFGMPINIIAAVYTLITVIFTFFPPSVPVNSMNMNYSCVVYGGTVILGIVFYTIWGHKNYRGPSAELAVVR